MKGSVVGSVKLLICCVVTFLVVISIDLVVSLGKVVL